MKNLFSYLPKKVLTFAAVLATVAAISGVAMAGFGPDRPTLTWSGDSTQGADHVVFNSYTNNPFEGDEREFLKAGVDQKDTDLKDPVNVVDGDTVTMRIFVHNNADAALNSAQDEPGIAKDTKVRVTLPASPSKTQTATAYIAASNALPAEVFDTLDIIADSNISVSYVAGSARWTNNNFPGTGTTISDDVVTTGALIGDEQLDGKLPGNFEFAGWVTLKVKVGAPNFTLKKQVRLEGQSNSDWKDEINVEPGQVVEYKIEFTNSSGSVLSDVTVRDDLAAHTTLVPGSTVVFNAASPDGASAGNDNIVSDGGLDVGDFSAGATGSVVFKTAVGASEGLDCGVNKLTNTGFMRPGAQAGWLSDAAIVTVDSGRTCQQVEPVYSCDGLQVQYIDKTARKVKFIVEATAKDGAVVKRYLVDPGVTSGDSDMVVFTDKASPEYIYPAGQDQFVARLTVEVDAKDQTTKVTDENKCKLVVNFGNTVTTTSTELPNTGAVGLTSLFAAASIAGAYAFRIYAARRESSR